MRRCGQRPQGQDLQGHEEPYYTGYLRSISTATGAVNADYVLVQMCASVATDAATPEAAAAEAERRAKRVFPPLVDKRHHEERSDEAIHTFLSLRWIASLRSQ